jgi:glycosyltransferase involved in cell wall biosynthesis
MRIGIDGRYLFIRNKTGVSRYLAGILRAWVTDPRFEFHLYLPNAEPVYDQETRDLVARMNVHVHRSRSRLARDHRLWFAFVLPWELRQHRLDWYFSPDYFLPYLLPRALKRSMMLMDISYVARPRWFPLRARLWYTAFSTCRARAADIVFTISEFSRKEIEQRLRVPRGRIVTATCGHFMSLAAEDAPRLKEKRSPYFFYVGEMFTRRCIPLIIEGFTRWIESRRDGESQLLLRGKNLTHPFVDIEGLVREANVRAGREAVRLLPRLDDAELLSMYVHAIATIYISRYEGFGLPVLESMALGANVVTARCASLPEVGQDGVVYVPRFTPRGIGEALSEALKQYQTSDPWRREHRKAIAATFSWKNAAGAIANTLLTNRSQGRMRSADPGGSLVRATP